MKGYDILNRKKKMLKIHLSLLFGTVFNTNLSVSHIQ